MKTKYTKKEIRDCLEQLQKYSRKITKTQNQLAAAQSDAERFQAIVNGADDEIDYSDETKVTGIGTATTKLAWCTNAINRLEVSLESAYSAENMALLNQGAFMAAALLEEIADRRLETVSSGLLMFSESKENAILAAKTTDACRSARSRILRYTYQMSGIGLGGNWLAGARAAEGIQAVLEESLKDAPDLLRFLPFRSAATTAE